MSRLLSIEMESSLRPSRTASLTFARSRRSSGGNAITASWIAASIIGMLSTGLSAHSHQRSKELRANFKRVLFHHQFTVILHDTLFNDIGFNTTPHYLRLQSNPVALSYIWRP